MRPAKGVAAAWAVWAVWAALGCASSHAQVAPAPPDLWNFVNGPDPAFAWSDTHYAGYLNETGWTGACARAGKRARPNALPGFATGRTWSTREPLRQRFMEV
jgi:hypothetical protein